MILRLIAAALGILGLVFAIICVFSIATGNGQTEHVLFAALGAVVFVLAAINETLWARLPKPSKP